MNEIEPVEIDLRHDAEPIAAFLRAASKRLSRDQPGRIVTGVQIPLLLPGGFIEVEFFDNPGFQVLESYDGFVARERFYLQHWGVIRDVCFHLPTQTTTHTGDVLVTEVPPPPEHPANWDDVVKAMGALLVQVVTSDGGGVFAPLAKAAPLRVGIYNAGDDEICYWQVLLTEGRAHVQAEHPADQS